jgi:hypothetical protein
VTPGEAAIAPSEGVSGVVAAPPPPPEPMPTHLYYASLAGALGIGVPMAPTEQTGTPSSHLAVTPGAVEPEIGRFVTPRIALGILGRLQLGSGADLPGSSTGAVAVLVRARVLLVRSRLQVALLGDAGYGYLRYPVSLGKALPVFGGTTDSAKAGPLLAGLGTAVTLPLTDGLALAGTAELLAAGSAGQRISPGADLDLALGVMASF